MVMDIESIKKQLPHRYPFLLIDRIIEQSPGSCTAVKNITVDEPFFVGHFPEKSVLPGMLLGEAMAQAAAFVGRAGEEETARALNRGFLTSINLSIKQPVIPGDQLIIKVKLVKTLKNISKFNAETTVDGMLVASGEFNIAMM